MRYTLSAASTVFQAKINKIRKKQLSTTQLRCPCDTKQNYDVCCGRFISGNALPATPEELMRSRYTAYTKADFGYITRTMKPPASNHFHAMEAEKWVKEVTWAGLKVISARRENNKGFVEFIAYFSSNNMPKTLHEVSEFHFENGQWYYVDGRLPAPKTLPKRPGRNDLCYCGSGVKYKNCCINNKE